MNLLPLTFLFPLVGFLLLSFSRGRWSETFRRWSASVRSASQP